MKLLLFAFIFSFLGANCQVPQYQYDSLLNVCNQQKKALDSIRPRLFIANYTLSRIRYHVDIVGRKPSSLKYLRGWVLRDLKGAGK